MHRKSLLTALLLVALLAGMVPAALVQAQGSVAQLTVIAYSESFDLNDGGYITSGYTSWAWGAPVIGAHSSPNVWGTNLAGNYNDGENGYLYSPLIDLSSASGTCTLGWWQWRETESNFDYISTEISSDGGNSWALTYGPDSGSDTVWRPVTVLMGEEYDTAEFQVRFHFTSDGSATYRGWYIDDVTVDCPMIGPKLMNSFKTAPAEVVGGDTIPYTLGIVNSGTMPANGARLQDPIPDGTTYVPGSVSCTAGTCSYDSGGDRIVWDGTVAGNAAVTITFAVDTDGLPCGAQVVNSAAISATLAPIPITRQATTRIISTAPAFNESFDGTVFPPDGWSAYNRDGDGTTWVRRTTTPHSGAGAAFHVYSPVLMQDGWLVTPRFTVTSSQWLLFWQRDTYPSGAYYGRHSVLVTTGASPDPDLSTYTELWNGDTETAWEQTPVDLDAYIGQQVYVAFRYEGQDADNWYIDDVMASQPWYPCPVATLGPGQEAAACPAEDATYPLVAEHNYLTDTFDIAPSGNSWPTGVLPLTVTSPMAGTIPVTVTVRVPWDAVVGATDVATITFSGRDHGLSAAATLATTAIRGRWSAQWQSISPTLSLSPFWGASYYEDGNVCVVGGIVDDSWDPSDLHACYDISAAAWFTRTSLPVAVALPAYGLIGGKFYVAGGYLATDNATTTVQVYDIASGIWDTAAPLPSARCGQAGGVVDGKLYSAGGAMWTYDDPGDCPTYEYDPATNSWTERASCPLSFGSYGLFRGGSVGSSYHHRLFAGGGRGFYWTYAYPWYAYDPASDSWQGLGDMPPHIQHTPLIVEDPYTGIIYQIGGMAYDWAGRTAVNSYDYLSNSWSESPPDLPIGDAGMLGPAYGALGDPDGEGFWTIGGLEAGGENVRFWEFTPCPALVPGLSVAPGTLDAAQCRDDFTGRTLTICNDGRAPLSWAMEEVTGTRELALGNTPGDVPWLSAAPLSGTLGVRECQAVAVTLDSTGLMPGGYHATLLIGSNDPATPAVTVPVTLTVNTLPVAVISAPPLEAALCPNATATTEVGLCNAGECRLDWTAGGLTRTQAPVDVPWLSVAPAQGALSGTTCVTIAVSFDAAALAPGVYVAGLEIANNDPLTPVTTLPVTMTVHAMPGASFAYSPTAGYLPLTVYFTDTSADAISPTWDLGDGAMGVGATISHTYSGAGEYTATLAVQSRFGCGTGTAVGLVRAAQPGLPLAGFASSTPDCLGDTTAFTNTTVGMGTITYAWAFGDGATSAAVNPTHAYATAGAYTVTMTATNAADQPDTVSHEVIVGEAIGGTGIVFWPAEPVMAAPVYFTASISAGSEPVAYEWTWGDGAVAAGPYVSHTFAMPGAYTVTLRAANACGEGAAAVRLDVAGSPGFAIYLPLVLK